MHTCPHCSQAAIPAWRKLVMSPGFPARCSSCGGESGITYPAWMLAMLPGTALMVAALFVQESLQEWLLNGIGILLMIVLPYWFAPLQKEPCVAATSREEPRG